jgi:hypothetical protein
MVESFIMSEDDLKEMEYSFRRHFLIPSYSNDSYTLPTLKDLAMERYFNNRLCYELLSRGNSFIDYLMKDMRRYETNFFMAFVEGHLDFREENEGIFWKYEFNEKEGFYYCSIYSLNSFQVIHKYQIPVPREDDVFVGDYPVVEFNDGIERDIFWNEVSLRRDLPTMVIEGRPDYECDSMNSLIRNDLSEEVLDGFGSFQFYHQLLDFCNKWRPDLMVRIEGWVVYNFPEQWETYKSKWEEYKLQQAVESIQAKNEARESQRRVYLGGIELIW